MEVRTALLIGATGLIGGHCLNLLLDSRYYREIILLTRRELPIKNNKLSQLVTDFDQIGQIKEFPVATDLYCSLGSTMKRAGSKEAFYHIDFTYTKQIAEQALARGTERFLLVSSVGADAHSSNFYLKVKGEIEAAIAKMPFKSVDILRPSILLGERGESRPMEAIGTSVSKLIAPLFISGLRKYRPIEASVVAFAMHWLAINGPVGVNFYESDQIQAIYDQHKN